MIMVGVYETERRSYVYKEVDKSNNTQKQFYLIVYESTVVSSCPSHVESSLKLTSINDLTA